jgi:hypothetical protein
MKEPARHGRLYINRLIFFAPVGVTSFNGFTNTAIQPVAKACP